MRIDYLWTKYCGCCKCDIIPENARRGQWVRQHQANNSATKNQGKYIMSPDRYREIYEDAFRDRVL